MILYERVLERHPLSGNSYDGMKQYLLSESKLATSKKPIMWIHIPYEHNAREWASFGSRSSTELNQPYLYLTVQSIIKQCDDSFSICLIDDETFDKLLPNWSINMNKLADPMKENVRRLGIAKLIHAYGGMSVPISFLCMKDLTDLYSIGTKNNTMFVCENVDTNITASSDLFYPNSNFMGALKENDTVNDYIEFMQRIISGDYTAQVAFLGDFDRWCNHKIKQNKMKLISGTHVGTKTINDERVIVDTLLREHTIDFYKHMYGIWIPNHILLKRTHYEWFVRMNAEQILNSNFILAKYFKNALTMSNPKIVKEPKSKSNNWIDFWRVPLTNGTLNIFGPKPQFLGNNIPSANNSGNID